MELFFALLVYFGSVLFPIVYLAWYRGHGRRAVVMKRGLAFQVLWILLVTGLVTVCYWAGYGDSGYLWALILPVNWVGFVCYPIVLVFDYLDTK